MSRTINILSARGDEWDYHVVKYIKHQQEQFLANGGTFEQWPEELEAQGVVARGPFIKISDKFELAAKLKFV